MARSPYQYCDQAPRRREVLQGVINVGNPANPRYIPQELCTVLPGQPYNQLLKTTKQPRGSDSLLEL
ncbi:hypothetical protein LTR10_006233 [Elasticomyces elasticus]|nr:hypothetical protein LTR10_006233 [Elasticomyces elasticus]KAK4966718.1 hypothetical protein LTR42_011029 [Elasticomyces elasticus]